MSLLSRIVGAAKLEEEKASESTSLEATFPDPDFTSIPEAELDAWAKRYTLRELARRLIEDKRLSALRKTYANRIFLLTIAWLIIVVLLVIFSGITLPERRGFWAGLFQIKFQLSETVLIAFIGTTTVNVIALFLAVTAWLFPKEAGVHIEPEKMKSDPPK